MYKKYQVAIKKRIADNLMMFTAELVARYLVLQWVEKMRQDKVVICSDFLAPIKSLKYGHS